MKLRTRHKKNIEQLEAKRRELLEMMNRDRTAAGEGSDEGTADFADRANNAYSRELNFSLSQGDRQVLQQVEDALERVEKGTYGVCSNCAQEIPQPRLDAVPWAPTCIDCQEIVEKG